MKKNNKKSKFVIPLSNETLKKAALSATIIAGGFISVGNTSEVYADSIESYIEGEENVDSSNKEEMPADGEDDIDNADQTSQDEDITIDDDETLIEDKEESPSIDSDELNKNDKEAIDEKEIGLGESPAEAINLSSVEEDAKLEESTDTEDSEPQLTNEKDHFDKNQDLNIAEENLEEAQKAGETERTEPNYSDDEKQIKDYSKDERYRTSDLQQGNPKQVLEKTDESKEKDGFKYSTLNPGRGSENKREYGIDLEIDKEKGQRTYTGIAISDTGRVPVEDGEKEALNPGEKLSKDSPEVTYKPEDNNAEVTGNRNRQFNYIASEETLKHINNSENNETVIGFKDSYTQNNNLGNKFFENESFRVEYKVNPWPNENDYLQLMKLKGEYNDKVFVQGQDIDTGVRVDNAYENDRKRLVGQVYHPVTGEVVPGASAYIGDDGNIHIQIPKGALKQNEDGKYVVDKDSIFSSEEYKAIQHLDVKFFARPRTKEEFENIAKKDDIYGDNHYVSTGAGTEKINHNGKEVEIDKQGIDRYDHYNLIGTLKLNLDDTRYYDQSFKDNKTNEDTSKHTSTPIKPGETVEVGMYKPEDSKKTHKSADEMDEAYRKGEATGSINFEFLNKANEGKDEEEQWKVEADADNISRFKITPPKSAKAGDFVAIPIEYTYTNGSTDSHWFHFVVQESDNNRPEYMAEIGFKGDSLTNTPTIPDDEAAQKKNQPKSYELVPGTYKDSAGNTWTDVKIDEKTGVVTAVVPEDADIKGGENLFVPVKVNYEDENGENKEEIVKAQFIARPKYKTEITKEFESDIPFDTKVVYDENLEAGKTEKTEGVVGKTKTTFKQVAINGEKGIINDDGEFVKDKEMVETKVIKEKQDAIIRIGTKPATTTVEIPRGLDYELDYSKKYGDPEVVEDGNDGVVTITTIRNPDTGEITVTKTTTKEAKNKKIKIPAGTEGIHEYTEKIPFDYEVKYDPDFYTNYPDAKDNYKVVTEGKAGEKKTTWTIKNSQIVGEPTVTETKPQDAVIKVGQKDYTGTITHKESHEVPFEVEYKYSDELEAGQTKVEQKGEKGSYDVEYSQNIKNGEKDGNPISTKTNEKKAKKEIIVIGTKPVTKVVEKPFNTEYVYDENLEAGKTEEKTPGKNGKVTITTSYDKDQNKVVTSETEDKATNRVVKVGGKTNGTEKITEEIPFEVEVRKDPSLKKGEWKYATDEDGNELKGEKGRQEKTLTIVNSKITETSDPTVTKKAKKAVILVGDGANEGTHDIVEKKEIPFETKIEYDDSLKPGEEKEVTKGSPGEKQRTNTIVVKDGKVVEVKEGEFKTTKEPTDRVVKIGRKSTEGETTKTIEREIPYETRVIYDDTLEAGTQKIEKEGKAGKEEVTITQKVKDSNPVGDSTETTKAITEKEDRIVRIGVKPVEKETELPFETEYVYDENMEAGKTETTQVGKKGKAKITTSFNKETGKLEIKVDREEPTKQIVKYGSKTDGELKFESEKAYDIIIKENSDLEAGKTRVIQEGKPGKTETTVKIENSKEVSRDTKTIIEKQDKIIEFGTKNVCEIPPVDPEKPGEETPKDPEGEEPKKPGKEYPKDPGEKSPENPEKETPEDPSIKEKEKPAKPGKEIPSTKNPENLGSHEKNNIADENHIIVPNPVDKTSIHNTKGNDLSLSTDKVEKKIKKTSKSKSNPKTGISGLGNVAATLITAASAYVATKKKKDDK